MAGVEYLSRLWWCAVAASFLAACGGSVVTGSDSGGGSAAGGQSVGGASGGAAAGAAAAGAASSSCAYQGKTYAEGATFPAADDCNHCSCHAGQVACTLLGCAIGCESGGQSYQPGQTFKVDCNSCTCEPDGSIACTAIGCQSQCAALEDQYAAALKRAKACDPTQTDQCTGAVSGSFSCGCSTPVNANNTKALAELANLAKQVTPECITPCPPCLPGSMTPVPATCTPAGSCENAPIRPGETSCKVGGVVYPSGSTGIPDPTSCNKCSCENGRLNCTDIGCGTACPAGTTYGTQCAQCGPTDACQIVEYACLPVCTDTCSNGICAGGICRQVCG